MEWQVSWFGVLEVFHISNQRFELRVLLPLIKQSKEELVKQLNEIFEWIKSETGIELGRTFKFALERELG